MELSVFTFQNQIFKISEWDGQKLNPRYGFLAIDTETYLVDDWTDTPDMVTFQAFDGETAYYIYPHQVKDFMKKHAKIEFVFHNFPFDHDVICKLLGYPKAFIYKLDNNLIADTSILYRLVKLSEQGWVPKKFNLALCTKEVLFEELPKDDHLRMNWEKYDGVEFKEIPQDVLIYGAKDVAATYFLYNQLKLRIPEGYRENELTHRIQIKGDLALNNIYKRGIGIDPKLAQEKLDAFNNQLRLLQMRLGNWGFIRGMKGTQDAFENAARLLKISDQLPKTREMTVEESFSITSLKQKEGESDIAFLQRKSAFKKQIESSIPLSTKEDDLKHFKHIDFISDYLEFHKLEKLASFLKPLTESKRVHPRYTTIMNTGRTSCIAKGELVTVLGGKKPIEKVKVGDYVYSYNYKNEVELKKVTRFLKQGKKKVMKINWKSIGNGKSGTLICTPDHKIKVRELSNPFFKKGSKKEGWYRADELAVGDRLFHVARSNTPNKRPRIYSADLQGRQEQLIIKEQIFKCYDHSSYHIHHKNGRKDQNSLKNLEIVSVEKHASSHTSGRTPWNKGKKTRNSFFTFEELKNMYRQYYFNDGQNQRLYNYIKRECRLSGFKLRDISRVFVNNREITNKELYEASTMTTREASKFTGLDYRTLKKALEFEDMSINHVVESIEYMDEEVETYDLTVEDNHNFIASEICVHNCSKPNIQQLPRDGGIREVFQAPEGRTLVIADYSSLELATLAQVCYTKYGESRIGDLTNEGKDLHIYTATHIYKKDEDKITKKERQFAKIPNYGFGANMSPKTFVPYCAQVGVIIDLDEAKNVKKAWLGAYPEMKKFFNEADHGKPSMTLTGRVRANCSYTAYLNTQFQGLAADGAKLALYECFKNDLEVVAFVHDEIVIECDEKDAEEKALLLEKIMVECMQQVTPDVKIEAEPEISKVYKK